MPGTTLKDPALWLADIVDCWFPFKSWCISWSWRPDLPLNLRCHKLQMQGSFVTSSISRNNAHKDYMGGPPHPKGSAWMRWMRWISMPPRKSCRFTLNCWSKFHVPCQSSAHWKWFCIHIVTLPVLLAPHPSHAKSCKDLEGIWLWHAVASRDIPRREAKSTWGQGEVSQQDSTNVVPETARLKEETEIYIYMCVCVYSGV